jgi:hypothetical protein
LEHVLEKMETAEEVALPGNARLDSFECVLASLLICAGRDVKICMHHVGIYAWELVHYNDKVTVMVWDLGAQGAGKSMTRMGLGNMVWSTRQVASCASAAQMTAVYDNARLMGRKLIFCHEIDKVSEKQASELKQIVSEVVREFKMLYQDTREGANHATIRAASNRRASYLMEATASCGDGRGRRDCFLTTCDSYSRKGRYNKFRGPADVFGMRRSWHDTQGRLFTPMSGQTKYGGSGQEQRQQKQEAEEERQRTASKLIYFLRGLNARTGSTTSCTGNTHNDSTFSMQDMPETKEGTSLDVAALDSNVLFMVALAQGLEIPNPEWNGEGLCIRNVMTTQLVLKDDLFNFFKKFIDTRPGGTEEYERVAADGVEKWKQTDFRKAIGPDFNEVLPQVQSGPRPRPYKFPGHKMLAGRLLRYCPDVTEAILNYPTILTGCGDPDVTVVGSSAAQPRAPSMSVNDFLETAKASAERHVNRDDLDGLLALLRGQPVPAADFQFQIGQLVRLKDTTDDGVKVVNREALSGGRNAYVVKDYEHMLVFEDHLEPVRRGMMDESQNDDGGGGDDDGGGGGNDGGGGDDGGGDDDGR